MCRPRGQAYDLALTPTAGLSPPDRSPAIADDARPGASCPTWALDDAPVDEDQFGSHEPVAAAIHELITREDGGRTIGLEGRWGSGKSTVVRLLAERMSGQDERVAVFDAWAHEGDPLRRSFLETLIDILLGEKEWVDGKKWRERREHLSRRDRVEHTRPRITPAGIVAGVLFAVLVPSGVALLNAGLSSGDPATWRSGAGILGGLAVFALAVAGLAHCLRRNDSAARWLELFSVQSVTQSDRETVETPDPTSVEFEREFGDLMCAALDGHPTRRLVLVVDNLDRVAPEDARAVWATLQTFLHHTGDPRPPWLDSLWVLLPYDRGAIDRLWDGVVARPMVRGSPPLTLADSFLDKSIQVHFEVPLLLLSDWREYLASLLRCALPEHDADHYALYRLYQYQLAGGDRAPSPRELKLYVNRIGALHRRWQHDLPIASLAYYASQRKQGPEVAADLRREDPILPGVAPLLDASVEAHLAAIAFGAPPERALQLLYGPLIDNSLMREEADGLVELAGRTGFWEALAGSGFMRASVVVVAHPSARREPPCGDPGGAPPRRRMARRHRAARPGRARGRGVAAADSLVAARLADLFSLVGRADAEAIAARATAVAIDAGGGAGWAEGAHALLRRFGWLTLRVSGDAERVCEGLAAYAGIQGWEDCAARLSVVPADRPAFEEALAKRVAEEPEEALRALEVLSRADPGITWEPLGAVAAQRLTDYAPSRGRPPQPSAEEAQSLLGVLRASRGGSPDVRATLVREGPALEYVDLARAAGDDAALGDWLCEVLRWSTPRERAVRAASSRHARPGKEIVDLLFSDPTGERVRPLVRAIRRLGDLDIVDRIRAQSGGEQLASALAEDLDGA